MRILFSCGNAPGLQTGYGGQALLALQAFQQCKAHVTILAWNLPPQLFEPFQVFTTEDVVRKLPMMSKIFEPKASAHVNWTDVDWCANPYHTFPAPIRKQDINKLIVKTQSELFVTLQDIFMFQPGPFACLSATWMPLHFVPVEHPTVLALSDFDMQLPISGWGSLLLQPLQNGNEDAVRHIEVVPHGRNTDVFNPKGKSKEQVQATRERWNWPQDAFVVLLIASNSEESGRKAFDAQLQGFVKFVRDNPDKNIWLHIHSEVVRAYDLGRLLETFGEFADRASFTDVQDGRMRTHKDAIVRGDHVSITAWHELQNVSESDLVAMYHACDVLLAATCSEGCGVPILEAQLCGTPVVTTRATAMWEETMFGISVKPLQWISRMDFNSGWMLPDSKGIAAALKEIAEWTQKELDEKLEKALPKLQAEFSNDTVVKVWSHIVNDVVKPSLITNFKSDALQVSDMRKTMLKLATATRKRLQLMESLEDEHKLLDRECKELFQMKQIAKELKLCG